MRTQIKVKINLGAIRFQMSVQRRAATLGLNFMVSEKILCCPCGAEKQQNKVLKKKTAAKKSAQSNTRVRVHPKRREYGTD